MSVAILCNASDEGVYRMQRSQLNTSVHLYTTVNTTQLSTARKQLPVLHVTYILPVETYCMPSSVTSLGRILKDKWLKQQALSQIIKYII